MAEPATASRILVVDDHPLVREGLGRLISQHQDLLFCGEAATGREAIAAVATQKPDLVLLDLRLRGEDGLELIKALKAQFPHLKILIISQYDAPLYAERALRAGALGYVVKEQAAQEVLNAIRTVLAGDVYLTRGTAALLLHKFIGTSGSAAPEGIQSLSDRELHVLQLLGTGLSSREIAGQLSISFKTVETHRENIKKKLGLTTAAALIHFATTWAKQDVSIP
ncbi:MAG TPA: response regulator transcription factor, partial [Candidatus Dormibacteraeota bacterium]|nr:response regulator transcription factor [Candidatus Dormibacteraeota bacterium]